MWMVFGIMLGIVFNLVVWSVGDINWCLMFGVFFIFVVFFFVFIYFCFELFCWYMKKNCYGKVWDVMIRL